MVEPVVRSYVVDDPMKPVTETLCVVKNKNAVTLGARKGTNIPGAVLDLPALTERDKRVRAFVLCVVDCSLSSSAYFPLTHTADWGKQTNQTRTWSGACRTTWTSWRPPSSARPRTCAPSAATSSGS